jgi:hypothetical protein
MAKIATWNFTDTALTTSINTKATLVTGTSAFPNLATDFVTIKNDSEESVASNTTSPIGKPETLRFGLTPIANIYKSTPIEKSVQSPTTRGYSLLVQVNDVLSVVDADVDVSYDLPISAHVVFKFPADSVVTPAHLRTVFNRLQQALYDPADLALNTADKKLAALMRGALTVK